MSIDPLDLSGFSGVARLFPLPDFVLFPHVVAPLHIFEPRYRQMTVDALAGDRLIAPVLLKPGYETDYEGTPAIYHMACLAQIMQDEKLADGRFNLVVRGVSRFSLEKEQPTEKLYRLARGRAFPDSNAEHSAELRQEICDAALPLLPNQSHVIGQVKALFKSKLPLGSLCDVLSFALPLSTSLKQTLLEQLDAEARARLLIHELRSGAIPELLPRPREGWKFPPDFSAN